MYRDPNGKWLETAFDVTMAGVSIKQAWDKPSFGNIAGAVLDVAAVVIPVVPAVGGRAIDAAQAGAKIVNKVDTATDTGKAANAAGDASGQARFVVEPNGTAVDTAATPAGRYQQPDGSLTDVLQKNDHGSGHSHTHEVRVDQNPQDPSKGSTRTTGETHPVTYDEAKNIESGEAKPVDSKPKRRQ